MKTKDKIEYELILQLTKHKDQKCFRYIYKADEDEDIMGIKETVSMLWEDRFGTPVRCTKIIKRE